MKSKSLNLFLSFVNLALYIAVVTINALANILPINGKDTGTLSDNIPNLFVPAGVTFSIWGLIYILLLIYVIYQIYVAFSKNEKSQLSIKEHIVFQLTCVLNVVWILAWHYEKIGISLIIMSLFLVSLIYLFLQNRKKSLSSIKDKLAINLPINVYLGWISVATIANVTALLVTLGWNGFGIPENIWTILVMLVGTALAVIMVLKHSNIAYSLVVVWAYSGIIIKRYSVSVVYQDIIITAFIAISLILVLSVYKGIKLIKK